MSAANSTDSKNLTPTGTSSQQGGAQSSRDLTFREDLAEVKQEAINRRIAKPKSFKENFWYKVNPYSSRKIFINPPTENISDHLSQIMLKELLKAERPLRVNRKKKLKVIRTFETSMRWFFEDLEAAEFAEYYIIQKWISKLYYGYLRESEEISE